MKRLLLLLFVTIQTVAVFSQTATAEIKSFTLTASQGYRKTPEGPRREYRLTFDAPLFAGGTLTMECNGHHWSQTIDPDTSGITVVEGMLPIGNMEYPTDVTIRLQSPQTSLPKKTITLPGARKWTLYFLAHSHQDIGYTHTQAEVMTLQGRNLERAIELAAKTADYPDGARFKWNTEATWSVKGYLDRHQGTEKAQRLLRAIRDGVVGVDASLGSILTGICKQEELMHIFDDAHQIAQLTGSVINTAMMSDVPGQSWGFVTALARNGVKYYSPAPNYVPSNGKTGCGRAPMQSRLKALSI
ncbi:MAG: hypothetical protein LBR67_04495 [Dysgonamonadaceae bacterium]|nr:hypothetical protein [Dysgonamonadaceae bacterium]